MFQQAMILAAGLGTRFKPWTDRHPKALAMVKGKSLLQRNIEYLQRFGIYDVVVNVHHFAEQIIAAVQRHEGWGSRITISDETELVLETGGGLLKAAPFLERAPFVLMNTDVLTDLDLGAMIAAHQQGEKNGSTASLPPLATLATTDRRSSRYLLFDAANCLCGWKNTGTGEEKIARRASPSTPRAFSGIQVIEPRIFSLIRQQPALRGKFSMIDVYLLLAATEPIRSFDHSGGFFIDVGRPEAVEKAEALVARF